MTVLDPDRIPLVPVEAPAFVPAPYGLLDAATVRPMASPHAGVGLTWSSETCQHANVTIDPCVFPDAPDIESIPCTAPVAGLGFTVYAAPERPTVGWVDSMGALAERQLLAGEAWAVEHVVWNGSSTQTDVGVPGMFDKAEEIGADLDPITALAMTESRLGDCYGGRGLIHVSRYTAIELCARNVLRVVGNRMETCIGTPVAVGSGYGDPMEPRAAIIGTGPMVIERSGIDTNAQSSSMLNRQTNRAVAVAARTYAVAWDCCTTLAWIAPPT